MQHHGSHSVDNAGGRQSQTFITSEGSTIGYAEYGHRTGYLVIYLHGLPGSRFEAELYAAEAQKLGLRIIAPDRPGIGLSSPVAGLTLLDYPTHISRLVRHVGAGDAEEFAILATSGGGPYALACAAHPTQLPGLRFVGVVAGLGPRDLTNTGMSLVQRLSFAAMDWVPTGVVRWLWDTAIANAARNPDEAVLKKKIQAPLAAMKRDAGVSDDDPADDIMVASMRAAFAQGSMGYVQDATIISKSWRFRLSDITGVRVEFWYGSKDSIAPVATGWAMAAQLPHSALHCFEGEGHAAATLLHRRDILARIVQVAQSHSAWTKSSAPAQ